MSARGHYGMSRAAVAGALFHAVGDRDKLVEETDTSFNQLINELYRKMGGDPETLKLNIHRLDPANAVKRIRASDQEQSALSAVARHGDAGVQRVEGVLQRAKFLGGVEDRLGHVRELEQARPEPSRSRRY